VQATCLRWQYDASDRSGSRYPRGGSRAGGVAVRCQRSGSGVAVRC